MFLRCHDSIANHSNVLLSNGLMCRYNVYLNDIIDHSLSLSYLLHAQPTAPCKVKPVHTSGEIARSRAQGVSKHTGNGTLLYTALQTMDTLQYRVYTTVITINTATTSRTLL
jgi:hypothetical protein